MSKTEGCFPFSADKIFYENRKKTVIMRDVRRAPWEEVGIKMKNEIFIAFIDAFGGEKARTVSPKFWNK